MIEKTLQVATKVGYGSCSNWSSGDLRCRPRIAAYLERIDLFLAANAIPDNRKVPVFLTLVGGQTYALLRDLLSSVKPSVKTLAQLKETLKKHYEPKKIIMVERFWFHQR